MQTDVKSATAVADGTAVAFRTRVKGLVITTGAVAGSVVLRDGGASGPVITTVATPAVASLQNVLLPGQGLLFETNVYVDLTDVPSVTLFYA